MVTYVYEHTDNGRTPPCGHHAFKIQQKITDPRVLTHCPKCGEPVRKVITGGYAVLYKGDGWTRKDHQADKRVEERLANGDLPEVMDTRELGYYPGPGEGAIGP
jgi:predicted nucleic acid-binding Zn ribbon protein